MSNSLLLADKNTNALEIIEFYIDETLADGSVYRSYYGMNVAKVLEIIRIPTITALPGKKHEAALGSFNLRERVLPIVDLGVWLDKKVVITNSRKVIVTEFAGIVTAFIVSGVMRIHRMTWGDIEHPGKYLQAFSKDSVIGVLRLESRILFLLDMEHIIGNMDPKLNLANRGAKVVGGGASGRNLRILVVDDSPSVRNLITQSLMADEYTVMSTTSGVDAWNFLQNCLNESEKTGKPLDDYVDLVISDIEMPEMDGHTLTRKIKAHPQLSALPVVLFSAIISDIVRQKGYDAGADDQIAKPDLPQLAARVHSLIHSEF
jgi:Chemotaxis signal transduction protein